MHERGALTEFVSQQPQPSEPHPGGSVCVCVCWGGRVEGGTLSQLYTLKMPLSPLMWARGGIISHFLTNILSDLDCVHSELKLPRGALTQKNPTDQLRTSLESHFVRKKKKRKPRSQSNVCILRRTGAAVLHRHKHTHTYTGTQNKTHTP